MSTKIVTVFGATGNQGGSVIATLLSHPVTVKEYKVRAITRDTTKESAKKLAAEGCEVVQADLDDEASLRDAIAGSYAVYGVTNYWEKMDPKVEFKQGKGIADACIASGVKHLVWSSLPPVTKLTGGKLTGVEHFDSKAQVEDYIEDHKKGTGMAASYYMPAFFMSNIKGSIQPGPDGVPTMSNTMPAGKTVRLPTVDIRTDTGKFVAGILEAGPEAADGAHVHGVSAWHSPEEYIEILSEIIGTKVKYQQIPRETFKGFLPAARAEELAQNFDLITDYHYYGLGEEEKQAASDRFLLQGTEKVSWEKYIETNGPWQW